MYVKDLEDYANQTSATKNVLVSSLDSVPGNYVLGGNLGQEGKGIDRTVRKLADLDRRRMLSRICMIPLGRMMAVGNFDLGSTLDTT